MKYLFAALTLIFLLVIAAMNPMRPQAQASSTAPETGRTPVVVELFTSEGCSSCPPADALLARLSDGPLDGNVQLIALEEHVDYWNDLGWADPFSSRDLTLRQYVYSGVLRNGNPYTPQMVVDGRTEFVGGQVRKARQVISESARTEKAQVTVVPGSTGKPGTETLSVKIGKLPVAKQNDKVEVWLAITETGLHSDVKRGENSGQDLHHAAVVRSIRKIGEAKGGEEVSFAGDVNVVLQSGWKRENLKAVVFVQEKKGLQILGAAEAPVAR
jgi:hypothetical protein